ncbi:hypothetical protein PDY_23780 [Photobacterium damselae subsp. damselae]|nr:hypothetical protein PDY_23780 [Photobacterium damselae subsp. damselae]
MGSGSISYIPYLVSLHMITLVTRDEVKGGGSELKFLLYVNSNFGSYIKEVICANEIKMDIDWGLKPAFH